MQIWKAEEAILYEDEEILVAYKPAGIAVQSAGVGSMDLESLLKNELARRGKPPYLAVVHRLDQPVEGVLVFGKTPRAAENLSRQTAEKTMEKYYLAVTDRTPPAEKGVLEDYLKRDGRKNVSAVVTKETKGAKRARLSYEILKRGAHTLVGVRLETGRHHQIRVQMAHAEMPLLGDRKYNPGSAYTGSLALCAAELRFCHPKTGKRLSFATIPQNEAFSEFAIRKEAGHIKTDE